MVEAHPIALPADRAVKLPALLACQPGGLNRKNIADKESCFFNCLHSLTVATVVLIADLKVLSSEMDPAESRLIR
jgi:hypothetical protein